MDKQDVVNDIHESFLTCSICFQLYNKPKALPCLHTFCEGCLRDYVASRYEDVAHFPCPLCRHVHQIPPTGVLEFPDNHLIISLLDTVSSRPRNIETSGDQFSENEQTTYLELTSASTEILTDVTENEDSIIFRRLFTFGSYGQEYGKFLRISGIDVFSFTDDIAICDELKQTISVFRSDGECLNCFKTDCLLKDIAWTPNGNLLVTVSRAGSSIMREYTRGGTLLRNYGSFYTYENPNGLTLNGKNEAIVTSLSNNCIHVFTSKRKMALKFGSKGSGSNHFFLPNYVTSNSKNDVIVSDTGNHRVKVHRRNGEFVRQFGGKGILPGDLFYPKGICTDALDNIYVADANNYRVQVFSPEGKYISCPLQKTYTFGADIKPTHVAITPTNNLVVVLQGPNYAVIHIYNWMLPEPTKAIRHSQSITCNLMCCFRASTYDGV